MRPQRAETPDDLRFMDAALALAYAALGSTAPNPAVGCVIVRQGRVIAAAATAPGGRPHAETQALDQIGGEASDASVYVTLEPCAHHGATPPCAEALVRARPRQVIIACRDPFEKVSGRGAALLEAAGLPVLEGVRRFEAEQLNIGFFSWLATGRPVVIQDARAGLYDAVLDPGHGETPEQALERMGREGITRARVRG